MEGADFVGKYASVAALVFSDEDKDLERMGVKVLPYEKVKEGLGHELKVGKIDTMLLIPPARKVRSSERSEAKRSGARESATSLSLPQTTSALTHTPPHAMPGQDAPIQTPPRSSQRNQISHKRRPALERGV
jgi:hypothetical protein